MSGLKRGTLNVHASRTIASHWLPPRLVAFRRAYPQIEVKLVVGNTAQNPPAVIDGTAELGFVEGFASRISAAQAKHDRSGPTDHRHRRRPSLGAKKALDRAGPRRRRLGVARTGLRHALGIRSGTVRQRRSAPEVLKIILELPTNEAVRAAVEAGAGVTAISELVVEAALRAGTLVAMAFQLPARPFLVLNHRDRYHPKQARLPEDYH